MNNTTEPIYRYLVPHIDVIKQGDQYKGNSGTWYSAFRNIGETYNFNTFHLLHRRLDVRAMNIREILNNK
jgi:hypothetical protein